MIDVFVVFHFDKNGLKNLNYKKYWGAFLNLSLYLQLNLIKSIFLMAG
jgi:hypothetical protein